MPAHSAMGPDAFNFYQWLFVLLVCFLCVLIDGSLKRWLHSASSDTTMHQVWQAPHLVLALHSSSLPASLGLRQQSSFSPGSGRSSNYNGHLGWSPSPLERHHEQMAFLQRFLLHFFFFLRFTHFYSVRMSVCLQVCVCVAEVRRGCQIMVWMLGTGPGSSATSASALTAEPSVQATVSLFYLLWIINSINTREGTLLCHGPPM